MKLTFLGTGTSQGVPVIGCRCAVCTSTDSRDTRFRTSAMIEVQDQRFIIDAGPDFRMQLLRAGVRHINAILLTHEHKDHTGGIDDVRALNFVDYPEVIHRVPIYGTPHTLECIRKDYHYAFGTERYRGVPEIELMQIDPNENFSIGGVEITPIEGFHSDSFKSTGYRVGALTYLTDFRKIADSEVEKIMGSEVLVVNSLRYAPHSSHFNFEQALELINRVKPRKAYLTHMSHEMGLHCESSLNMPQGVEMAYDMLEVNIED